MDDHSSPRPDRVLPDRDLPYPVGHSPLGKIAAGCLPELHLAQEVRFHALRLCVGEDPNPAPQLLEQHLRDDRDGRHHHRLRHAGRYALVFLRTPGKAIVTALFVASLFFPARVSAFIGIFQMQNQLGLINKA